MLKIMQVQICTLLFVLAFAGSGIAQPAVKAPLTPDSGRANTLLASLRPNQELRWQRTSPTVQQPDGPVLYQLLFSGSGTPGTVPAFDTNPRHLTNSPITVTGGNVVIGGAEGLTINGVTGIVTFPNAQTFPGTTGVNTVTAGNNFITIGGTPANPTVGLNTANTDARYLQLSGVLPIGSGGTGSATQNFVDLTTNQTIGGNKIFSNTITTNGNLALPNTASASVGVITLGGTPFLHNIGSNNTFAGANAGSMTISGAGNSGFGVQALTSDSGGMNNAAFGLQALQNNTLGSGNAAFGFTTLRANIAGSFNTALGLSALQNDSGGSNNIAIGSLAGSAYNGAESNNIDIGNGGVNGESNVIRIGNSQTSTFIAGISGINVSGSAVMVNGNGQLGVVVSSSRYKQAISDMAAESDVLMKLRPVAFYYKPELDGTHTRQYGLVAEEVAAIAPGLVLFDDDGKPQTVRYHFVNAMLLNEVQKQRRLIEAQQEQLATQQNEINRLDAALREEMKALHGLLQRSGDDATGLLGKQSLGPLRRKALHQGSAFRRAVGTRAF